MVVTWRGTVVEVVCVVSNRGWVGQCGDKSFGELVSVVKNFW